MIDHTFIKTYTNLESPPDVIYNALGLSNSNLPGTLSFLDDEEYLVQAMENENIIGIITKKNFLPVSSKRKIALISEDPRWDYFTLYNVYSKNNSAVIPNKIASTAKIHKDASIADNNVIIGENTIIGPNVSILENVEIGNNCVIKPGAVVGADGFEHKRTSKGIISVYHDGKVIIGNNVEIGSNTCVDKGFSFKNTIIENNVRIDNLVHVAHCVTIRSGAFIIANAMLGGSTEIGNNAWVAPSSSIRDRITIGKNAMVGLGATVTKSIPENEVWIGNPAKKMERK